jgi:hypothetical protein
MLAHAECLSSKRSILCSRAHAHRVAARLFDDCVGRVIIIRTDDPLQPFRVSTSPSRHEHVELEMVS